MRVAVVSMYTAQRRATAPTERTRRTVEGLAARGHDVVVLCAQWWEGEVAEFDQNEVTYRAVTETPAPTKFASKLPFALRKVRPEVIQVVNSPPSHVVSAKTAARFLRTPVVVDWWDDHDDDSRSGSRRAARAADAVLTPSEMVRTQVREYGASEETVRVVPESIDMSLVRDAPVDDRADLVYARDLDEHANVESFLLALAELRGRDWRAVVIGDGPRRGAAEATAEELRIDGRVDFLGELPDEERVPILKGAHVFAQTATREPFATGLLWGLACGCVGVVEYQTESSAHELVREYPRGAAVTSPQELADEIVDAGDLERWSVAERFAPYDHETVLDRYVECYREVVDGYGLF